MMFFDDNRRRIDFVIVYGEPSENNELRKDFEDRIQEGGLEIEYEDKDVSLLKCDDSTLKRLM